MKEVIKKLQQDETRFTIKGIKGTFVVNKSEYDNIDPIFSIKLENNYFSSDSMNVDKFTASGVCLYTFDMFGQKISRKIKYIDITFVEE